ncbi:MAG: rRNA maturation RNase YbeY [Myxococcota bacterium]|nr:rRNA maturation RNase YbeY [Myxococcota bacterium]
MPVKITGPPDDVLGSRVDPVLLRKRAQSMLSCLGHARSELSIALVDDREIRDLNQTWRNKNRATDVLSFSLIEGDDSDQRGTLMGDVVISVETAAAQARERHRGLNEEVTRLVIHGLLHIVGFDHENDEEARNMRREQRRLWNEVCA